MLIILRAFINLVFGLTFLLDITISYVSLRVILYSTIIYAIATGALLETPAYQWKYNFVCSLVIIQSCYTI
jgi:hypothetical protein